MSSERRPRERREASAAGVSVGLCFLLLLGTANLAAQSLEPRMDPGDAARQVHTDNGYPESIRVSKGGGLRTFPSSLGADGSAGDRRSLQRSGRTDLDDYDSPDQRRPGVENDQGSGWQLPNLGQIGGFGQMLSWGLLIIGVVLLVLLLAYLAATLRPRGPEGAEDDAPTSAGEPRTTTDGLPFRAGDPDALAREGKYAEAILALLVQSLRSVGWRPSLEGSLTAREVLRSIADADPRRAPLAQVVEGVERVRFAGAPATRAAYEALVPHRDAVLAATRREAA